MSATCLVKTPHKEEYFLLFCSKGTFEDKMFIKVVTFSFVQKCKSVNCRRMREFYSKGNRLFFFFLLLLVQSGHCAP